MAGLTGQVWAVLAAVAGLGILSVLHVLASSIQNATYVHDKRVQISALRKEQAERIQALNDAAAAAERESRAISAARQRAKAA